MPYSRVSYTADGATAEYTIPFPYLNLSSLEVSRDGTPAVNGTDYTVDRDTSKVIFISPPASGVVVKLKRVTPRGVNDRLVVFTDPSNLDAASLNLSDLQLLYIIQEALDDIAEGVGVGSGGGGGGGGGGSGGSPLDDPDLQGVLDDIIADHNTDVANLNAEVTARAAAILAEHNDRVAALLAEASDRNAAILSAKTTLETADASLASSISVVNAQVNNVSTGLPQAHARITAEETTRATAITAVGNRVSSLESQVNAPGTGILARITTVESTLSSGSDNTALAFRVSTLESQVNTASTGLLARVSTIESTQSSQYSSLSSSISTVSATANTANTTAAAAQTTANGANTTANNANTVAGAANTNASSALSTANTANTNANTALSQISSVSASVTAEASARATADGNLSGQYVLKVTAGNRVAGMRVTSVSNPAAGDTSEIVFDAAAFKVYNGSSGVPPFSVSGGIVSMQNLRVGGLTVDADKLNSGSVTIGSTLAEGITVARTSALQYARMRPHPSTGLPAFLLEETGTIRGGFYLSSIFGSTRAVLAADQVSAQYSMTCNGTISAQSFAGGRLEMHPNDSSRLNIICGEDAGNNTDFTRYMPVQLNGRTVWIPFTPFLP